jgi:hypothetical protein
MKVIYHPVSHPHPNLTKAKTYEIIGISPKTFLVMDDSYEPCYYPQSDFVVIDPAVPADWIWEYQGEEDFSGSPAPISERGFNIRLHDGELDAVRTFLAYLASIGFAHLAEAEQRLMAGVELANNNRLRYRLEFGDQR